MSSTSTDVDTTTDRPPHRVRLPFWAQVLLGLGLGIGLGFVARTWQVDWLTGVLDGVGSTFVGLLRVVVVPLVLTAIIVSIANLRQVTNAARLALQTLLWFAITSLIAVTIGITLGLLTNPGASATVNLGDANADAVTSQGSWTDFLSSIIPANILGLEASSNDTGVSLSFNILQLVVLGIALGAAALAAGEKAEPFINLSRSVLEVVQKLVWWIIRLAPIGTAGLIGRAVADYGWDLVAPLAVFTADVYIGCAIVLFVVYPLLARAHGLSARRYFAGAWPAIQFAFVSRSSVGTLPLTQRVVTRNLGVSPDYASFAVPFGATTKMDGCAAIYPALAAITVAQLFGIELTVPQYLLIAFVSVVGSAATAGLTGAVVMLTLTLSTLGLPLEGVALLLAIDPILDMMRTATNVAGQALIPVIVAKRNGLLDEEVYNSANVSSIESDEDPRPDAARQPVGASA